MPVVAAELLIEGERRLVAAEIEQAIERVLYVACVATATVEDPFDDGRTLDDCLPI